MGSGTQTETPVSAGRVSSEILDRLPPQHLEAERGVLGSILLDPRVCDEVSLIVRPEDFHAEAHRRLYRTMLQMRDEGQQIDVMLLAERLRKDGQLEAVGGTAGLAEILQSVPVAAHAAYYANIVRDKATLRELIHTTTEILRDAYDPTQAPQELITQAEEKIFRIHDSHTVNRLNTLQEVLVEVFAHIDRRLQGEAPGVPTHFTDLDQLTGGLHESELVILAARPSMGKTALACNIAENVTIKSHIPTLFVSLEMSRLELVQRMLCSQGRIDGHKFRSSFLSAKDRSELVKASAELSQAPLFIDDTPSRNMAEIAAIARRLKRQKNLGLLVIDYLQLIEPDNPKDPRQEQVARIARRLKGLARELSIPVLCLAQVNRQVEQGREIHRPRLSHLRESGAIEQDADVVMFIHREEYYCTPEEAEKSGIKGLAEVIVAKQRNGPVGEVKLTWLQQFTRFADYAEPPYEEFATRDEF